MNIRKAYNSCRFDVQIVLYSDGVGFLMTICDCEYYDDVDYDSYYYEMMSSQKILDSISRFGMKMSVGEYYNLWKAKMDCGDVLLVFDSKRLDLKMSVEEYYNLWKMGMVSDDGVILFFNLKRLGDDCLKVVFRNGWNEYEKYWHNLRIFIGGREFGDGYTFIKGVELEVDHE